MLNPTTSVGWNLIISLSHFKNLVRSSNLTMATLNSESKPDCIDIIHLIEDIYAAKKSKSKFVEYLHEIRLRNNRLIFNSHIDLIQFIKQTVSANKKKFDVSNSNKPVESDKKSKSIFSRGTDDEKETPSINWMSVLYNKDLVNVSQKLGIISPILSLYKKDHVLNTKQFQDIKIIRQSIPNSCDIKGIINDNYMSLNIEQLFGEFDSLNVDHLSLDLCKQIVSYLDIQTFFKCSEINHCWLNLIYRNDSFYNIIKQCTNNKSMKCVVVDHSSLNRMESIYLSKIYINWQLRANSINLDFITLQKSWIQHYIDPISVQLTLQEYKTVDDDNDDNDDENAISQPCSVDEAVPSWIDIKSVEVQTKKLFDSMDVFDVQNCMIDDGKDDEKHENDDKSKEESPIYRLKIDISKPFKWTFYSESCNLRPFDWHKRYHGNHEIGIATEQQFWFEYYLELLFSMIDSDISQALATIMEAAQRMRFDNKFVMDKLMKPEIMKQIVRLVKHKDWRIQHNAAILLANLFATSEFSVRAKYLELCTYGTEYNVIDVTLTAIYKLLKNRQFNLHEAEYRVCRSLICVIGNYVISHDNDEKCDDPDKWKKLALTHSVNYVSFMTEILNQEASAIAKQSVTNEPIKLGTLFFLPPLFFVAVVVYIAIKTFYRYEIIKCVVISCDGNMVIMHILSS